MLIQGKCGFLALIINTEIVEGLSCSVWRDSTGSQPLSVVAVRSATLQKSKAGELCGIFSAIQLND